MGLILMIVIVVLVGVGLGWVAASGSSAHHRATLRRATALIDELEREAVEVSDVDPFARAQLDLIRQYRRRELD